MTLYADPLRCPDCRGSIPLGTPSCPHCRLSLRGDTARKLFVTLSSADSLLTTLRAESDTTPERQPVPSAVAPVPAPLPAAVAAPAPARGLSAASVPKILLGLGAACLLVAALVFLAVTWSVLGIAGRTVTLVGFTAVAGLLADWMARRGLRGAAEALSLVTLGLLTLDVLGARHAGWLGHIGTPSFLVVLGAVLVVAGSAATEAARRTAAGALTGTQVVSAAGLALLVSGTVSGDWATEPVRLVVGVLVAAAVALGTHRLDERYAALGGAMVAGVTWVLLAGTGIDRARDHDTVRGVWLHLEGWPVLAAAVLVAAPALVRRVPVRLRVAGLSVAVALVAVLVVIPADGSTTELTLAVLGLLLVVGAGSWSAPRPWGLAGGLWLGLGGAWTVAMSLLLAAQGAHTIAETASRAWTGSPDGHLVVTPAADAPAAWLLPALVLAAAGVVLVLVRASGRVVDVRRSTATVVAAATITGAVLLAAAGYPLPVWVLLAGLLLAGVGFLAWWLGRPTVAPLAAACLFLGVAVPVALYDERLTAAALLVIFGAGATAFVRAGRSEVAATAGAVLAAALAGSVWTWGAITGAAEPWTALAGLVVLSAAALGVWALPGGWWATDDAGFARNGLEVGAAASALPLGLAGVLAAGVSAGSTGPTWTAVYLTVAGVAVCVRALLVGDRQPLGWVGGGLLALASWVRLADLGVHQPEAYTLPAACALLVVGCVHLRRHVGSSTMAALAPGLGLALAPSLLWVLWEPATLRALLLGLGCLALLAVGLRMRWSAPVVFAATVGGLLVLRLAAPYIGEAVPRWVLIGAAGAVLVGAGVTWERRLGEARQLIGYVRDLR